MRQSILLSWWIVTDGLTAGVSLYFFIKNFPLPPDSFFLMLLEKRVPMGQIIPVFPICTEVLLPQGGISSPQGHLLIERLEMARHEPQRCNSCRKEQQGPFLQWFFFPCKEKTSEAFPDLQRERWHSQTGHGPRFNSRSR